jgi:hypothetical protein
LGKAEIRSPGQVGLSTLRAATTVDELLEVPPPDRDAGGELGKDRLVYMLHGCPRCGTTGTLGIDWQGVVLNLKRQEQHLLETLQSEVCLDGAGARAAAELIARLGVHRAAGGVTSGRLADTA